MNLKNTIRILLLASGLSMLSSSISISQEMTLEDGFKNPPKEDGVRCWWWWLNGNVTKEAITRDLEAMKSKHFSGAMIFDAGGAEQRGNSQVPAGPLYGSPAWRELFLHALNEAKRLGLELGLSIQSGWNLGGPNVTPDYAAKQLTYSELQLAGSATIKEQLPMPKTRDNFYRDICVLAFPKKTSAKQNPIRDLQLKSMYKELGGSAPDCRFLLNDIPATPGEEDVRLSDIVNLTEHIAPDGTLSWQVPTGDWIVQRFGYTTTDARVSTSSGGWQGMVIDYLRKDALDQYWNEVIEPVFKEAGPLVGTVLKQLETDSWECGGMNWTDRFRDEFIKFRGYDPILYLPIITGKIVENREISNRFLADFRKTLGDCVSENHYRHMAELAHQHNLQIQPESGGPHAGPLDAIKNLGWNDIVMGEFWAPSPHRPKPENRFFIKQSSSVAHTYGKKYVAAESFTTIGPHWDDVLWKSQKPSADHEFCSGLNMVFFHTFTCSPKEMGLPGQEYFAGTHINPQVTWWNYSDAFITYLNRCQYLLQQGKFVADVLYYYGDHVPNLVRLKEDDPAGVLPGYDYDVADEPILLQLKVEDGSILTPSGMRYHLLVLPNHKVLSLAALKKIRQLIVEGATVIGPKPERLVSLEGGEESQKEFTLIANQLWGEKPESSGQNNRKTGRLLWGKTTRQVLLDSGIIPDFVAQNVKQSTDACYIHYTIDKTDMYYVCNQTGQPLETACSFRIQNKQPELWNPITGEIRELHAFTQKNGYTEIPLQFTPNGSWFVVFRSPITAAVQGAAASNFPLEQAIQTLEGDWQVQFDPRWGGPASIQFENLISWTKYPSPEINHYSGKAVYNKQFDFTGPVDPAKRYWLDLGSVLDVGIASIRLNGKDLGIVWTPPFRVDITNALQTGKNAVAIDVVNSWRNRLVGDRDLPKEKRFTKTNITILPEWQLLDSGLLGPVQILISDTHTASRSDLRE